MSGVCLSAYERFFMPFCPLAKNLFKTIFRVSCKGIDLLPEPPYIVASNHRSHLDPPVLNAVFPSPLVFLAKEELFKPPLGWFMRHMRAVPVKRRGDTQALSIALSALEKGCCVGIFPEGTRAPAGSFLPPKPGIGVIAIKSGVPVVPVLIEGTDRSLPRGASLPRPFVPIKVKIGEPVSFKGMEDSTASYRKVAREVMSSIQSLAS